MLAFQPRGQLPRLANLSLVRLRTEESCHLGNHLERNPLILLFSEKLVSFEDLICFEKKALVENLAPGS